MTSRKTNINKDSTPNLDKNYFENLSFSPNDLIKDYKDLEILSLSPKSRKELESLIKNAREDLQKLGRIIRAF